MFSLYQYLCWSLVLALCLTANCAESPLLQNGWHSDGLFSSLTPRSAYDSSDPMTFDDMPECAKKSCLPLDPNSIGCPANMTKACYCSTNSQWACASGGKCVQTLFEQWLAHVCLAIPLEKFDLIPTCARSCIQRENINRSCSLQSAVMVAWRTDECVTYESGPTSGTPSLTTAGTKSTTVTSLGASSMATIIPSSTGAVPESTIAPAPANGSSQRRLPSMAITALVAGMMVFQIAISIV
ncbi:hypothetical protein Q9L58_007926 [Maublancomyces gigas]|uniref:Uncharacterized protein n=1 Tax=Discina gigas TaxID=1032678 RepID=A0ABR3GB91_9PEZI